MNKLTLHVKQKYFDQIKSGQKKEEYRLANAYWTKRLANKSFDTVEICLGYPKRDDKDKRISFKYSCYIKKKITHEHFGNIEQEVFAIQLQ